MKSGAAPERDRPKRSSATNRCSTRRRRQPGWRSRASRAGAASRTRWPNRSCTRRRRTSRRRRRLAYRHAAAPPLAGCRAAKPDTPPAQLAENLVDPLIDCLIPLNARRRRARRQDPARAAEAAPRRQQAGALRRPGRQRRLGTDRARRRVHQAAGRRPAGHPHHGPERTRILGTGHAPARGGRRDRRRAGSAGHDRSDERSEDPAPLRRRPRRPAGREPGIEGRAVGDVDPDRRAGKRRASTCVRTAASPCRTATAACCSRCRPTSPWAPTPRRA
jgi:hypothetical protein